ncbi:MAG: hypothetical protein AAGJ93_00690 [Bacteroidota bacterium]
MPFIAKLCAVTMLILLVRYPAVAQQVSARLAAQSFNCTDGNSLLKSVDRSRIIREGKKSYLSLGVHYDRATTFSTPTELTIERQSRIGTPLLLGTRKGRYTFEAGSFLGVCMSNPQESFWYANPELTNTTGREINPTAALMLNIGAELADNISLNLRYMHMGDLPDNNVLGRLQLGWSWNW